MQLLAGADILAFHLGDADLLVRNTRGEYTTANYSDVIAGDTTAYNAAVLEDGETVRVLLERSTLDDREWFVEDLDENGDIAPGVADDMAAIINNDADLHTAVALGEVHAATSAWKEADAEAGRLALARAVAVLKVVDRCNGNQSLAARMLGLDQSTVNKLIGKARNAATLSGASLDAFVAQIRRNAEPAGDALEMLTDIREARISEGWDQAVAVLERTETPLVLGGARYATKSQAARAIDAAANEVWERVRDLFDPEIEADAGAIADLAVEGWANGAAPDEYLEALRFWRSIAQSSCAYPAVLESPRWREEVQREVTELITNVVQTFVIFAVTAVLLKDHLTDDQYRSLTYPFDDLTDAGPA
jgi:hypothetical protein